MQFSDGAEGRTYIRTTPFVTIQKTGTRTTSSNLYLSLPLPPSPHRALQGALRAQQ